MNGLSINYTLPSLKTIKINKRPLIDDSNIINPNNINKYGNILYISSNNITLKIIEKSENSKYMLSLNNTNYENINKISLYNNILYIELPDSKNFGIKLENHTNKKPIIKNYFGLNLTNGGKSKKSSRKKSKKSSIKNPRNFLERNPENFLKKSTPKKYKFKRRYLYYKRRVVRFTSK